MTVGFSRVKSGVRSKSGAQLAEFGAAIAVFCLVFFPMANLVMVPVRWVLLQELVSSYTRQLAFCETFGQCCRMLDEDANFQKRLRSLSGVGIESAAVQLRVTRVSQQEELLVSSPKDIPAAWLPNGAKAPCLYQLELRVDSLISPAILATCLGSTSIPGISAPFPIMIKSSHQWANLGRNPVNGKFFLNE